MAKKMEATIVYWGLYRDNGKENGSYHKGVTYAPVMENQMDN